MYGKTRIKENRTNRKETQTAAPVAAAPAAPAAPAAATAASLYLSHIGELKVVLNETGAHIHWNGLLGNKCHIHVSLSLSNNIHTFIMGLDLVEDVEKDFLQKLS